MTPRTSYIQLESGQDNSVATILGQWNAVSGIFDGVLGLYAVKIVVSFYKVQYEHIKWRCGVLCLFQIPLGVFLVGVATGQIGWRLTKVS